MTTHLPLEWLSGYLDGRVSAEERRQVEAHLDACAICHATLEDLGRTVALVQDLEPVGAPAAFRTAVQEHLQAERSAPNRGRRAWPLAWSLPARPTWRAALPAAAVVLIGLFSVNLWQELSPRREVDERVFRQSAPAPGADVRSANERDFGQVHPVAGRAALRHVCPAGARAALFPGPRPDRGAGEGDGAPRQWARRDGGVRRPAGAHPQPGGPRAAVAHLPGAGDAGGR